MVENLVFIFLYSYSARSTKNIHSYMEIYPLESLGKINGPLPEEDTYTPHKVVLYI